MSASPLRSGQEAVSMFPAHRPKGQDQHVHGSLQSGYDGATWLCERTTLGLTPVLLARVFI